jgi:hypothetical protein
MSIICEFLNAPSFTVRSFCSAFVLRGKSVNDRPRASGSAASLDGRTSGKLKRMMNERTQVTVMTQLRPCHYFRAFFTCNEQKESVMGWLRLITHSHISSPVARLL